MSDTFNPVYDIRKLDIEELYRKTEQVSCKIELSPQEIRLLSKLNKKEVIAPSIPGYFSRELHMDFKEALTKFFSIGLIEIGFERGRKRLILTQPGENIVGENDALLLYYNGLSSAYVKDVEVVEAQRENPGKSGLEILENLYLNRLSTSDVRAEFGLRVDLQKIYRWQQKDDKVTEMQERLDALFEAFERKFEEDARRATEVLGLSLEERQRLQQEAIDEMDSEWEIELDRKNRAKAGIE